MRLDDFWFLFLAKLTGQHNLPLRNPELAVTHKNSQKCSMVVSSCNKNLGLSWSGASNFFVAYILHCSPAFLFSNSTQKSLALWPIDSSCAPVGSPASGQGNLAARSPVCTNGVNTRLGNDND
jgi:hypothetical protein